MGHEIIMFDESGVGDESEFFYYCGCGWLDTGDNRSAEPVIDHLLGLSMNKVCDVTHFVKDVSCTQREGHEGSHYGSGYIWVSPPSIPA